MFDPRIPQKNPWLAVGLGLLFPGGGHLYQGRTFKGVLYAVCIIGTFTYGMFLSDWTALHAESPNSGRRWGFYAQVPIGVPAAYALYQKGRYAAPTNVAQIGLDRELSAPFEGVVKLDGKEEDAFYGVSGQLELRPVDTGVGPVVEGRLTGFRMAWNPKTETFETTQEPIKLLLNSKAGRFQTNGTERGFEIDRAIYADPERGLRIDVVDESSQEQLKPIGVLRGTIPRSVGDWVAVPVEPEKLQRLHFELGKTYDLGLIYTWVASLLNVLVLWDAFDGPAYGYGDESPDDEDDSSEKDTKTAQTVGETVSATASIAGS